MDDRIQNEALAENLKNRPTGFDVIKNRICTCELCYELGMHTIRLLSTIIVPPYDTIAGYVNVDICVACVPAVLHHEDVSKINLRIASLDDEAYSDKVDVEAIKAIERGEHLIKMSDIAKFKANVGGLSTDVVVKIFSEMLLGPDGRKILGKIATGSTKPVEVTPEMLDMVRRFNRAARDTRKSDMEIL